MEVLMLKEAEIRTVDEFNRESEQRGWSLRIDRAPIPGGHEGWRLTDTLSSNVIGRLGHGILG